jgi:hemerythrin superfamily protein
MNACLADAQFRDHFHVCAFVNGPEEERALIDPFFVAGLRRGEKAVYYVDPVQRDAHEARLRTSASSPDMVEVTTWQDAHLKGGSFDQDRMMVALDEMIRVNAASGRPPVRLVGQMGWVFASPLGIEQLVAYEASVNEVLNRGHRLRPAQGSTARGGRRLRLSLRQAGERARSREGAGPARRELRRPGLTAPLQHRTLPGHASTRAVAPGKAASRVDARSMVPSVTQAPRDAAIALAPCLQLRNTMGTARPANKKNTTTDVLELLTSQHREVDDLFEKLEQGSGDREALFMELADKLAAHAAAEEKVFYPSVMTEETSDMLHESVEEHLAIKRVLADLIAMKLDDEEFVAKLSVFKEEVSHHAHEEEEGKLFPELRAAMSPDELAALGNEYLVLFETLMQSHPYKNVPGEIAEAAPLPPPS